MTSKCIVVSGGTGFDNLVVGEIVKPVPIGRQVLIRVHAAGVNRADTLQRKGLYPPPPASASNEEELRSIIGVECSGTVESLGPDCDSTLTPIGSKVMALVTYGAYSNFCLTLQDHVMKFPENFSFSLAAAIPEAWLTSYQLLHFIAKLHPNDIVLVHGAGSGVGTAVVQLISQYGAKSIVTAGSNEKLQKAKELGATYLINYKTEDFVEKVKEFTNGLGVTVILDCIGGEYCEKNIDSLAMDGRWVLYGTMGGGDIKGPVLGKILRKRASLIGTTLRNRSDVYKTELITAFVHHALPLFASGVYKPILDSEFPISKTSEAHKRMESNLNNGKIILTFDEWNN